MRTLNREEYNSLRKVYAQYAEEGMQDTDVFEWRGQKLIFKYAFYLLEASRNALEMERENATRVR